MPRRVRPARRRLVDELDARRRARGRRHRRRGPRRLGGCRGVRPVARRRRPRARAAARHVDRPRPRARRGRRARQHRASTCSATPGRCCTTPAPRPVAAKTTSPTGATSPSAAARGSSSSRTATSRTRSPASSSASVYLFELYARLRASTDPTLAAIAAKAVKEVDYHRDHATQWVLRLAGGTDESRRRMIARARRHLAVRRRAVPSTTPLIERLATTASPCCRRPARPVRRRSIDAVLAEAELELPTGRTAFVASGGGRRGQPLRAPRSAPRRDAGARPRSTRGRRGDRGRWRAASRRPRRDPADRAPRCARGTSRRP